MDRIDKITVIVIEKPFAKPLQNAVYKLYGAQHVFVQLETGGASGIGEVVCFEKAQANAFCAYLESMKERILGQDARYIRKIWKALFTSMSGIGHSGLSMQALGAVDTALWDLNGKLLQAPVWQMLGAERSEVPVYATGGWLGSDEELVEEALEYKKMGYSRFKMKLGKKDWEEDIRRVRLVQQTCGPDFEVMVDVNQGWDVKKALRMAPYLEELGITHFEEPVYAMNYDEQRMIRDRVRMDVVAGEKLYGLNETAELLMRKCVDKLNPDIARCGGVSGFMEVGAVANANHIPVSSHAYAYFSIPCIAAMINGDMAEIIPSWETGLFAEDISIEQGVHRLSEKPGFGCELSERALQEWCTAKTEYAK